MKFPSLQRFSRNSRCLVALWLFLYAILPTFAQPALPPEEPDPRTPRISGVAPGELIIRFKRGATADTKSKALKKAPGLARDISGGRDFKLLKVQGNIETAKSALAADPDVLYVEPNYKTRVFSGVIPDDFEFDSMYGLYNTGANGGKVGSDIKATDAWSITTGSRDIIVAVVDTGIDYFHEDLRPNMWRNVREIPGNGIDDDGNGYIDDVYGYDFVSNDSDPTDDHFHGTHVAGTIGAVGNNGIGIAGVAWNVRLMAVKAFDQTGNGTVAAAIDAIHYAVANGARIINASWGLEDRSRALADAVAEAQAAGVIFVAAAGNSKTSTPFYPAGYDAAIAVASINNKDQRSSFSNFGPHVDLSAPGELIISSIPDSKYDAVSGTSMSAPHVSGAAALILTRHPEFTPTQVAAILKNTADPLQTDQAIGRGRLNVFNALQIDVPLPNAALTLPAVISGRIDFRGSAFGPHFDHYALYYGDGTQPTNWTQFASANTPVNDGLLLTDFDSSILNDGTHTFKVVVWNDNGQTAADFVTAQILNVQLSSPVSMDILRASVPIVLRGTVFGQGRHYGISWAKGLKPTEWKTDGLMQPANAEVINGTLATFDASTVAPNEFYSFKLSATNASGGVQEFLANFVYLDSHLRPGWPIYLPYDGEYSLEDWRQAKVADLDGDGHKEIVIVDHGNSEGKIATLLVFRDDGTLAWKRELNGDEPYTDVPTIGDIDGDGKSEIFVDVGGKFYGFTYDGKDLPGLWPVTLTARRLGKVLADLDGDGKMEIVALANMPPVTPEGQPVNLSVYDREGRLIQRWALSACNTATTSQRSFPVVANLDNDREPEIVVAAGCNSVAVYDLNKADGPVWQQYVQGLAANTPIVADLFNDGSKEIVVASSSAQRGLSAGVYVFNSSGQVLPGWPALTTDSFSNPPAVGDIDGDGRLEIVIASDYTYQLFALAPDGFDLPGWPIDISNRSVAGGISIADVDGDSRPDVIFSSPGYMVLALLKNDPDQVGGISAWNGAGQRLKLNGPDSPYAAIVTEASTTSGYFKASPATLTDLDGDGKLDLVAASIRGRTFLATGQSSAFKNRSALYAWELNVPPPTRETPWPEFQRSPINNAYLPTPEAKPLPPRLLTIPDQIVAVGQPFTPIHLSEYLDFPSLIITNLTWSATGQVALRVEIDSNSIARIFPPTPDWQGIERITFSVTDNAQFLRSTNVLFEARLNFYPPVTTADVATLEEDSIVLINVLANDTNPTPGSLTIASVGRPAHGKAVLQPDGRILYTPNTNFFGADSFSYVVQNDVGARALGLVNITVSPVNDPPTAKDDRALTIEDRPVTIDVLANDEDVDGDPLQLLDITQPTNGVATITAQKKILFQPQPGLNGTNVFTYRITDGKSPIQTARVTVVVRAANTAPTARGQNLVMNRNSTKDIFYLGDDIDGDQLSFRIIRAPQHAELFSYPTFGSYTPHKGYFGTDYFSYKASDGFLESEEAFVNIIISDANNPPTPSDLTITTRINRPLNVNLSAIDLDDDPVTFTLLTQPRNGSLTGSGSNYVYRPRLNLLGTDDFKFIASDGRASATGKVSIEITDKNTAPGANPKLVKITPNTSITLLLTGADSESDPLAFALTSFPKHGAVSGNPPNVTYTPNQNYIGPDRFRFTVSDGEFTSDPAPVTFAIAPKNATPTSPNQTITIYTSGPSPLNLDARDADGDPLQCVILRGPRTGLLTGGGTSFVYTPNNNFIGADTFTYKAWDGHNFGNEAVVRVERSFDPPPPVPPRFNAIQLSAGGLFQLSLTNQIGQSFRLESSTNLSNWTTVSNVISPGTFLFSAPLTNSQIYFRAINQ